MVDRVDRLDGWKAIAAYFGRERTTVIRWARHRGMPVHSLPGGKTRTVYALASELDRWIQSNENADAPEDEAADDLERPVDSAPEPDARPSRLRWIVPAAGLGLVAMAAASLGLGHHGPRAPRLTAPEHQALPADPATAALLLQARDDWAKRTTGSLTRSMQEFQRVTLLDPHFAPAYADLADSYLLAGESGSLPPAVVFDGAQRAADQALSLDPSLASAHRAKAFIQYWWKHDAAGAGREFREAIRLDPTSSQTHFWYANVLADNGEDGLATREFDSARLADPGSDPIDADYAWARWISGHSDEAEARLRSIVAARPDNAEAQDCLAMIALSSGKYQEYLQALHSEANLRREPEFAADVQDLEAAFKRGGSNALLASALSAKMADQDQSPYPDHALAAYYASLQGNRAALMHILKVAQGNHEHWGSAGYLRRIRVRWQSDPAIPGMVEQLTASPVESARA
jgi:hypothetical protein